MSVLDGMTGQASGYESVREVCERVVKQVTGHTVDELEQRQASARAALLANPASLRAMHRQKWTHDAMRSFGSRFGVDEGDFVAVWMDPTGRQGPKRACWRLNPNKFPWRVHRQRARIHRIDRIDRTRKKGAEVHGDE